jgi:hypothetical protein
MTATSKSKAPPSLDYRLPFAKRLDADADLQIASLLHFRLAFSLDPDEQAHPDVDRLRPAAT